MSNKITVGILHEHAGFDDVRSKIVFDLSKRFRVVVFVNEKHDTSFFKKYPDIIVVPMKLFGILPFLVLVRHALLQQT
jgi:hypothetical protein